MVTSEDVLLILRRLSANHIRVWLTGGWGIDALLGDQTRPHKDLDILMLLDDVARMQELLAHEGYALHELWSENRWVPDAHGTEVATAFVLQDAEGRQVDAHALRFDDRGNGIPAWEDDNGLLFREAALAGQGAIVGITVPCLSPEMQATCHTGYDLPEYQLSDMQRLHERFECISF